MLSHRLKETKADLGKLYNKISDNTVTDTALTPRQQNIITALDEILEDISTAELGGV